MCPTLFFLGIPLRNVIFLLHENISARTILLFPGGHFLAIKCENFINEIT